MIVDMIVKVRKSEIFPEILGDRRKEKICISNGHFLKSKQSLVDRHDNSGVDQNLLLSQMILRS